MMLMLRLVLDKSFFYVDEGFFYVDEGFFFVDEGFCCGLPP